MKRNIQFGIILMLAAVLIFAGCGKSSKGTSGNDGPVTLTISTLENGITSNSTVSLSFDFSRDVTDFDLTDINTTFGTLIDFSGTGSAYTANLVFSDDGTADVSVSDGAATDSATGNFSNTAAVFQITSDGTAPDVTLSSPILSGNTAGFGSVPFTISFSETVTGFSVDDIMVTNGTLEGFSGTEGSYSVNVIPDSEGEVTLNINGSIAVDVAGNGNTALDEIYTFTYDASLIGVNFSASASAVTSESPVVLDITFDENMDGSDPFEIDDIEISGADLDNFSGSGGSYSVEVTPGDEGTVTVTVPGGVADTISGYVNASSSYSFVYDSIDPDPIAFEVRELTSRDLVASDGYTNEILEISVVTDYSNDGGSSLSFEYTVDNGLTWSSFSNPKYVSVQGTYNGINVRVSDQAGNTATGTAITDVVLDTGIPASPVVNISSDPVNAANVTAFGVVFTSGEEGSSFEYTISSSGGGTDITGSGTFDSNGEAMVAGIDISSLGDGTITLSATQTDLAGNNSGIGQDTVIKDTQVPGDPTVTVTSGDPVTSTDNTSFSFDISGGEEGLVYSYRIASDGGGAAIADSGTFDASGSVSYANIDLSAVRDGTLTVTVYQTDAAGNVSDNGTGSVTLDAVAVNNPDFDTPVDAGNVDAFSFILYGEDGSTYSYTISSTGGGTPLGDSGTFPASGEETVGPLDLSGLADGYLVLIVSITDSNGNSSTAVKVVEKSSVIPSTATADFSGESNAVTFDLCFHGTQTVPSGPVKYDTTSLIGSDHDDVILLSDLEDGESFSIDAGTGYNILDLSSYLSNNVTVNVGQSGVDQGTVTVDLGGGESASIAFSNIQRIDFSANNFTGSPHAIEVDSSDNTQWTFTNTFFELHTHTSGYKVGVVHFAGSLGVNYQLDTSFKPVLDMSNKNGLIIFDYQDASNYKYIRAYAKANKWTIGEVVSGSATTVAQLNETIDETTTNPLTLKVTGTEGKTAELWSNGIMKASYTFSDALNDGKFGITNDVAHTEFTINMTPTNWAPYVKNYNVLVSSQAGADVTLDLIGDAVDNESENLTLQSVSTSSNGTLTDNGNGTVTYQPNAFFYGIDEYTYQVSDGTNVSTGKIRFDVIPDM